MVNKFYFPPNLPITSVKDELIDLIKKNQVLIVAGETGSGKTTQLPKLCLVAECVAKNKVIACTQPRRIAASSVAKRVAEELGDEDGLVGYKVRFVDRTKKNTKIKFLTDGLLLAEAVSDKYLRKYDVIIIDEAHERSLNIDFLLGLLKKLIKKRSDLKVIISSATLDTEKFSKFFSNAKVVSIPGKTYPIEVRYLAPELENKVEISIVEEAVDAIKEVLVSSPNGDILVFMPTERDIIETVETVNSGSGSSQFLPGIKRITDFEALPLFGRMSVANQGAIFKQSKKRKIIIATNVAETSITVPGIRFVIDTGLARIATYSPKMRATKLPVQAISTSSADQRKGRCGRVGPGVCIRLYSEENYNNRSKHTPPEIMRSNLAEVILKMINLRLGHPSKFPFIDPPKKRSIRDGIAVLRELGAIKKNDDMLLTKRGRVMAKLPLDPCLSRIVMESKERRVLNQIIIIVAALSIQDPKIRPLGEEKKADAAHKKFIDSESDFLTYLNLWNIFHEVQVKVKSHGKLRKFCRQNFLAYQRMREWMDIYEQICRALEEKTNFSILLTPDKHDAIHQSLLSGFIRNIAFKKDKKLYTGAYGKEVMIFPGSGQFSRPPQWMFASELIETSRLYARTVCGFDPKWLEKIAGNLCKHSYSDPHWEKKRGCVVAYEKTTLFGLVINERRKVNYGAIDYTISREVFIQSALVEGLVNQRLDFLNKNLELIQKLQDIEDKVRTRHVIDEYTIYAFYDSRIPHKIVSLAELIQALPILSKSLMMTESDVLSDSYDHSHKEKFPLTLSFDKFKFNLFYKFEPGSQEDGVTVLIPFEAIQHINPLVFEWLVPGLFFEKVQALLKSLPKSIRKKLVPVNKTAENVLLKLDYGHGSLLGQLSAIIFKEYQLVIERQAWKLDSLPDHLKMRFCLVGQQGKVLKNTRDFNDLFTCELKPSTAIDKNQLKLKWEKKTIESIDDSIPHRVPVEISNGVSGYMYPSYKCNGDGTVCVKLVTSEEDQIRYNKYGMLALYKKKLTKQIKLCKKELAFIQSDWPLYHWLGSLNDVNLGMQDFIFLELFNLNKHCFQTSDEFEEKVSGFTNKGLFSNAAYQFQRIRKLLGVRRETYDIMLKFSSLSKSNSILKSLFGQFFEELDRLLPIDFFNTYSIDQAELSCRYMEALKIRAERAYVSSETDSKKALLIVPFYDELDKMKTQLKTIHVPTRKKIITDLIEEFQFMLEEYKISVFAPEMKTLCKVSAKRLLQKIKDFNGNL